MARGGETSSIVSEEPVARAALRPFRLPVFRAICYSSSIQQSAFSRQLKQSKGLLMTTGFRLLNSIRSAER
jgi:hypothetical protein